MGRNWQQNSVQYPLIMFSVLLLTAVVFALADIRYQLPRDASSAVVEMLPGGADDGSDLACSRAVDLPYLPGNLNHVGPVRSRPETPVFPLDQRLHVRQ